MQSTEFKNKSKLFKVLRIIKWTLLGIVTAIIFALIFGFLVRWLWGLTLTPLFGFEIPTYWQAAGMVILARLIFGGFHPGGHYKSHYKDRPFSERKDRFFHKPHDQQHRIQEEALHIPEDQKAYYREFWEKEGKQAFEEYVKNL